MTWRNSLPKAPLSLSVPVVFISLSSFLITQGRKSGLQLPLSIFLEGGINADYNLVSFTITLHILAKFSYQYLSPTHQNLHPISSSSIASYTLSSIPDPDFYSLLLLDWLLTISSLHFETTLTAPVLYLLNLYLPCSLAVRWAAERKWRKSQLNTVVMSHVLLLSLVWIFICWDLHLQGHARCFSPRSSQAPQHVSVTS